jgi:transmembrane sensor
MNSFEANQADAPRWFAALRRGALTTGERTAYEAWLAIPANRTAMMQLEATWHAVGAARGHLPRVQATRTIGGMSRRAMISRVAMVGVTLGAIGTGIGVLGGSQETPWTDDIVTAIGERRSLALADGSFIHLNVATRLKYRLTRAVREVALGTGQAEFVVADDVRRPFLVHSGTRGVRSGKAMFDVQDRQGWTSVAVREGMVTVSQNDLAANNSAWPGNATTLNSGEAVSYTAGEIQPVRSMPVQHIGEWRNLVLTYDQMPLRDIVRDLNLYFPGRIVIADQQLADRCVTLRLDITDRDRMVDMISRLLLVSVTRGRNDEIVLSDTHA